MDLKKLFKERLKDARLKKGITQDQLSKLTGINIHVITKYEQGLISPGIDNLLKLVTALEISSDYLILPHAEHKEVPQIKDPELYKLFFVLETLEGINREAAVLLLNSLVAQKKMQETLEACKIKTPSHKKAS